MSEELIEGQTKFQWIAGSDKGRMETLAGIQFIEDHQKTYYTFMSGNWIDAADLGEKMKIIRSNNDFDEVAYAQYKQKEEDKRKEENKKAAQKAAAHPEQMMGVQGAEDMKPQDEIVSERDGGDEEEADKLSEREERKRKEEEKRKKEEKKEGGAKKDKKKEKRNEPEDPLDSFLQAQKNRITDQLRVSLKIPPKEVRDGLEDSFPDNDVDEAIVEEAFRDLLSEETLESFKESIRKVVYAKYGRDREEELHKLGEGEETERTDNENDKVDSGEG